MTYYYVRLLDKQGDHLHGGEFETLSEAKKAAAYYLSDDWADRLGTDRAVINDDTGRIVWAYYR